MKRSIPSYLFLAAVLAALLTAEATLAARSRKAGKKAPPAAADSAPGGSGATAPSNESAPNREAAAPSGASASSPGEPSASSADGPARGSKHAYPADFKPPLHYGADMVGVSAEGTLRIRCRAWDDVWGKNLESYLAEAKANAAARGARTKKVLVGAPIQKNTLVTAGEGVLGSDGEPLRGRYTASEQEIAAIHDAAKKLADFFYAASDGELSMDFIFPELDGLKVGNGPGKAILSIWPRGLQDQLVPMLKDHHDGVIMWIFVSGRAVAENGQAGSRGKPQRFGTGPFGICYTAWSLYDGYCMACSGASPGLWVHEFNHRWLDGLKNHEGVQLTRVHSLGQLGFAPGHSLDEGYFDTYRHIIRPAMWRRFSITTPDHTPLEPFSGKAYAWSEAQDDCWFSTPELHNLELAELTGIDSFEIVPMGGSARLFTVAEKDRSKVLSSYVEPTPPERGKKPEAPPSEEKPDPASDPNRVQLDNFIQTGKESCAVVKTSTGQWLFVSANMADLYADMLKISGKGDRQLPVYGYVNEGILPLLVFKAPADMPLPTCEEGYFRAPMAKGGTAASSAGKEQ